MTRYPLVLSQIIFLAQGTSAASKPFSAKLEKLECDFNPILCTNPVCTLKPINRMVGMVNAGCDLTKSQTHVKIKLEVFTKSSSNAYYPGSFRFTDDFCSISSGSNQGLLVKAFPAAVAQASNYFKKCPISGPHGLYNFTVDSSIIPSALFPSGEHRLDIRESNSKNETIIIYHFYYNVKNQFY